jgi:hypothetical protein
MKIEGHVKLLNCCPKGPVLWQVIEDCRIRFADLCESIDQRAAEAQLFNAARRYRSHLESRRLAPGTINLRLGAVRRLAYEAADSGLLSSDSAAGIRE